jgi:O-antigen/teichoic acid export membrane protein
MYIFGTLLTANGSLKILNILALIALIANFGLNLWLIPKYQALGAAYAAIITQSFIGFSNCFFAYKVLKMSFDKIVFIKLLLLFLKIFIKLKRFEPMKPKPPVINTFIFLFLE